jgi:hypothetical protein
VSVASDCLKQKKKDLGKREGGPVTSNIASNAI